MTKLVIPVKPTVNKVEYNNLEWMLSMVSVRLWYLLNPLPFILRMVNDTDILQEIV